MSIIQRGHVAIPESPPSRKNFFIEQPCLPTTTELELGSAKSESPELDSSVHEVSTTVQSSKCPEMKDLDDVVTEIRHHATSAAPRLPSLNLDQAKAKAADTELPEKSSSQVVISEVGSSSTKPKFHLPVLAGRTRSNDKSATSSEVRDMFDPIDTESENSQALRILRGVKRLKGNESLPRISPGGHQSSYQNVLYGNPIIPSTLKPRPKLPADLQLRDFDGQNGPSSSVSILNQTSSQAQDIQEISNDSAEATPGQNRPQNGPRGSNSRADIANELAVIFNTQIPSTPVNPPKKDTNRVHAVELLPPLPQAEFSQPQTSSETMQKASIEKSAGREMENDGPNDIGDESIDLSPGRDLKEKGSHESEALTNLEDMKAPGKPRRGEKSKSKKLVDERTAAKGAENEAEKRKIAEGVEQEIARRNKVLREKRGDVTEAKLFEEKEKSIKLMDGKARKLKSRGEKVAEIKPAEKTLVNGAKSKTVRAAKLEKEKAMVDSLEVEAIREAAIKTKSLTQSTTSPPRKEEARSSQAATETEVPNADEGRSGFLKVKDLSKEPDSDKPITLKSDSYPGAQSRSSATSNSRNDSTHTRKSMTPAFPESSLSKSELVKSKSFVRTPSRHITNPDSLLRSGTVHPSSATSRPVTVSKDPSPLSSSPDSTAKTPAETVRKGINHDMINENPRGNSNKTKPEPKSESYAGTSKKLKDKSIQDVKTQTKLNISRDVKGKGRLHDPPLRPKADLQEPIVVDSASEGSNASLSLDDDNPLMRIGKAGPSSKRKGSSYAAPSEVKASAKDLPTASIGKSVDKVAKTTGYQASSVKDQAAKVRRKSLQESDVKTVPKTSATVKPKTEKPRPKTSAKKATQGGATSHTPAIKTENVIREQASPTSRIIDPRIHATLPSSKDSSPRAPAQYMSKAVSISSDSNSDADSGSESESESEFESESDADASYLPSLQLKSDQTNGTASQQKTERNANNAIVAQEPSLTNLAKSNESHILSKRTPEREADEQLQRETRQSIRSRLRSASPISSEPASDEEPMPSHPSVTHGGSVKSRLRPSNCPYPSMTELREKRSEKMKSQLRTHGPVPKPTSDKLDPKLSPLTEALSTNSSSSSEDDSDSDRNVPLEPSKVAAKGSNNNSPDPKPTKFKTVNRLLKGKQLQKRKQAVC